MKLSDITQALMNMSETDRQEAVNLALRATKDMVWVPNPGPQTEAFFTEADETFFGGQAGGGKTDLACGLALVNHERSLILRRINKDASKIADRIEKIVGGREHYNAGRQIWRWPDRLIELAGCELEVDKQRFKGDPHDLIVFDEGSDFLESQYRFIITWNRSVNPKQRCRVLVTSNPPTTSAGLWVIKYWGPWLDPTHPNPAKPGELRYFTSIDGKDVEVEGRGPHLVKGELIYARSRTFIPSALEDNPDLAATDYASVLAALPEELRAAYKDGKFEAMLRDADHQLIPSKWIVAAQDRWYADGWKREPMTAMGLDPAGGGADAEALAYRHGGWYGRLKEKQGKETAEGERAALMIIETRRNGAPIVVDMGGGYGGRVTLRLKDNDIPYIAHVGSSKSTAKSADGKLGFVNKRSETWWKFREALDPDQPGGSPVALPPDPELRADLASPTWRLDAGGIRVEPKEEIKKRLGRSTNKGDAVVMCWSQGQSIAQRVRSGYGAGMMPRVVMGHQANHRLLRR